MSIDSEPQIISSPRVDTIEESLARIGNICAITVPRPPIGFDTEDLAQAVALDAVEKGIGFESLSFLYVKHRAIDATRGCKDTGNREFVKAVNALYSGEPLDPVSNIWGQAAQRKAIDMYEGRGIRDKGKGRGTFAEPIEDRTASEYEDVETKVDGLLETLLEKCEVTSVDSKAKRNRDIVNLYLGGLTFKEIEDTSGVNRKTATSVWRNFFLQAQWYLEVMGIDLDTIRGNV